MRIVFFGTPEFSLPYLEALHLDPDIKLVTVLTQPDKPSGRKQEVTAPAVKLFAEQHGIPVYQPPTLKNDEVATHLRSFAADFFIIVAYGKIIPLAILSIPKYGCVNVHPSLLPKYRGPSPLQAALAAGDTLTGVSIMLLDEGLDTGPILAFENVAIDAEETASSLREKINAVGPRLLLGTIQRLAAGQITPLPQDNAHATTTKLLTRDDGRIDWTKPMAEIERLVRAFDPWPGTWTTFNGQRLKILSLTPHDFSPKEPGAFEQVEGQLLVSSADGRLAITRLQPEGKPPMSAADFLHGHKISNPYE